MEECKLLTEARGLVGKEEMREWETRHSRHKQVKKKKGPVGPVKEEEEKEEDKLEHFFCQVYEFHNPAPVPVVVPASVPIVPIGSALAVTTAVSPPVIISPIYDNHAVPYSSSAIISPPFSISPSCIAPTH